MEPHIAVRRSLAIFLACIAWDIAILLAIAFLSGVAIYIAIPVSTLIVGTYYLATYRRMDLKILTKINAEPIAAGNFPRFENLVEGICVAHGFRPPDLFVIHDSAPNMIMVGRNSLHGRLVATTGLLDRVTRVELEGLITHELSRTRNRLTLLESTAAVLIARPMFFLPKFVGSLAKKIFYPWVVAETDIHAVQMTRYPTGLADALRSLHSDGREPTHNPKFCRHMWVHPPKDPLITTGFSTMDRVMALGEL